MATIEKIDKELNDAKVRLGEAMKNLKEWEEKENKGKRLNELLGGEKEKWDGERKYLIEEKKKLEEDKEDWKEQVKEWGKALREFGGREGEGNEQIALKKKYIYFSFIPFCLFFVHSISFIYLFLCSINDLLKYIFLNVHYLLSIFMKQKMKVTY